MGATTYSYSKRQVATTRPKQLIERKSQRSSKLVAELTFGGIVFNQEIRERQRQEVQPKRRFYHEDHHWTTTTITIL